MARPKEAGPRRGSGDISSPGVFGTDGARFDGCLKARVGHGDLWGVVGPQIHFFVAILTTTGAVLSDGILPALMRALDGRQFGV
jgi:hypothetical protein